MGLRIFKCSVLMLSLVGSCGRGDVADCISNTTVVSEKQLMELSSSAPLPAGVDFKPASRIRPFSGTTSHHLLCRHVIDRWFQNLAELREVRTFVIISPNHGRLGALPVSLTCRSWKTAGKTTRTNVDLVGIILRELEIQTDDVTFGNEHGIEALLPFVNKYFPKADIVPILLDEKQRHVPLIMKLTDSLHRIFKADQKAFLLLSVDFSHRGDAAMTAKNDRRSHKALASMGKGKSAVSDNNGGLMVMFELCERMNVANTHFFCHTDSAKFEPEAALDITSYFFTFQY